MKIDYKTLHDLGVEFERAHIKHSWDFMTVRDMVATLTSEFGEVLLAEKMEDIHGAHGLRAELLQVAVVAIRAYEALADWEDTDFKVPRRVVA